MPDVILFRPQPLIFRLAVPEVRVDLVRERLMSVVMMRLQKITKANGYLTDFGAKVYRGLVINAEPETPSINFWDTDETSIKVGSALQENTLTIHVATYDKDTTLGDDAVNPSGLCTPAVNIIADIEQAMVLDHVTGIKDPTLGGLAKNLTYTGSNYVTGLQPELWIQTVSTFTLIYNTRIGDPFQQVAA